MAKPSAEYRRKEIIEATFKAIDKVGLSRISYDLIADEAGTSRQLIRHYYPTIEPLMVDLVESIAESYRTMVLGDISANQQSDRLSQLLDFFFGQLQDTDLPPSTSFDAMFALANNSGEIKRAMYATHQTLSDAFQTELRLIYPELHHKACSELGHLFVSLITGHWRMVSSLNMPDSYTPIARVAMDRLIASYVADYAGGDNG